MKQSCVSMLGVVILSSQARGLAPVLREFHARLRGLV